MDLIELGNLIMHTPWLAWLNWLLNKLGLTNSDGLHDLFCQQGCEIPEMAL